MINDRPVFAIRRVCQFTHKRMGNAGNDFNRDSKNENNYRNRKRKSAGNRMRSPQVVDGPIRLFLEWYLSRSKTH